MLVIVIPRTALQSAWLLKDICDTLKSISHLLTMNKSCRTATTSAKLSLSHKAALLQPTMCEHLKPLAFPEFLFTSACCRPRPKLALCKNCKRHMHTAQNTTTHTSQHRLFRVPVKKLPQPPRLCYRTTSSHLAKSSALRHFRVTLQSL